MKKLLFVKITVGFICISLFTGCDPGNSESTVMTDADLRVGLVLASTYTSSDDFLLNLSLINYGNISASSIEYTMLFYDISSNFVFYTLDPTIDPNYDPSTTLYTFPAILPGGDGCSVNFYGNTNPDTPYRYVLMISYKDSDTGEDMSPIILEGFFTIY